MCVEVCNEYFCVQIIGSDSLSGRVSLQLATLVVAAETMASLLSPDVQEELSSYVNNVLAPSMRENLVSCRIEGVMNLMQDNTATSGYMLLQKRDRSEDSIELEQVLLEMADTMVDVTAIASHGTEGQPAAATTSILRAMGCRLQTAANGQTYLCLDTGTLLGIHPGLANDPLMQQNTYTNDPSMGFWRKQVNQLT